MKKKVKPYYADIYNTMSQLFQWRLWTKQQNLICESTTYTSRNSCVRGLNRLIDRLKIRGKIDLSAIEKA